MIERRIYERMLSRSRILLERALQMEEGYLLNFTNNSFSDFFSEIVNIDPDFDKAYFEGRGPSKAKRFRAFVENAPVELVTRILRKLWEHRRDVVGLETVDDEPDLEENYFSIIAHLEGRSDRIDTSAIEAFEPSQTLEDLVAALKRDMDAGSPQSAMDRLHTYCMKRFGALVHAHTGEICGKDDPLHSRVGRYVKALQRKQELHEISRRIVKSSISIFTELNSVRNNFSLAHDTPELIQMEEARFVFESVAAILRYFKSIDGQAFEGD